MSKKVNELSPPKEILFYVISMILTMIVILILFVSFFAYKKLTLSYDYCNSFGEIHPEIGWTLGKDIDSCLTLSNKITGEYFFDTEVYTNSYGFRSDSNKKFEKSRILAIGDSWTFGYGVNYEQTYPYYLSKLLNEPVMNSGVPAYGTGSNFVSASKNIEKLKPELVLYLTMGMFRRSICEKPWTRFDTEPKTIKDSMSGNLTQLIPCYLIDHNDMKAKLIKPLPNVVESFAKKNTFPGGSLTAGYDSFWEYLFFTKPKLIYKDIKDRFKRNQITTSLEMYVIKKLELNSFLDLAKKHNFIFVLLDVQDDYKQIIINEDIKQSENFIYIDSIDWNEEVIQKSLNMSESDRTVPKDGHYGQGMNELIAKLFQKKILENNLGLNLNL